MNKDEYKEYDIYCFLLTSRRTDIDYQFIVRKLLVLIKKEARANLELIEENGFIKSCRGKTVSIETDPVRDLVILAEMKRNFEEMILSVEENIDDPNYIGLINIFSLQCSILFSSPFTRFYVNQNNELIIYQYIKNKNWTSYNVMKEILLNQFFPQGKRYVGYSLMFLLGDHKGEYSITDKSIVMPADIFLIKWMNYFDSNELVLSYFNKVYYCELVSFPQDADGQCFTPFEFLYHDALHAKNSTRACSLSVVSMKEMHKFYTYCIMNNYLSVTDLDKIKLCLFYELHEGMCRLTGILEKADEHPFSIKGTTFSSFDCIVERFKNILDLGLAIPKEYKNEVGIYLDECITTFLRVYNNWVSEKRPIFEFAEMPTGLTAKEREKLLKYRRSLDLSRYDEFYLSEYAKSMAMPISTNHRIPTVSPKSYNLFDLFSSCIYGNCDKSGGKGKRNQTKKNRVKRVKHSKQKNLK